jgi:hypothetical protein
MGALIRYIPHAVTVGFTCGIAVTIFASQLKDLGGLTLPGIEPGPLIPKLMALGQALGTISLPAFAVGIGSTLLIFALRWWRPTWPAMLIAVVAASLAALALGLPVETIGSHFGGIPHGLPAPQLPTITASRLLEILPAALSFTLLGGVESLLSAKVADGMTGRKHRYNMELVAQGIANIASALFGGISVTGTIARTATNIRAGARSPLRRSGRGRLVYGGEARIPAPVARLAQRRGAPGNVLTHAHLRPDDRHRERMRARRGVRDRASRGRKRGRCRYGSVAALAKPNGAQCAHRRASEPAKISPRCPPHRMSY